MKRTVMKSTFVLLACLMVSCVNRSADTLHSKNEKIIKDYYGAYEKKDWHVMELILDDGFTFTSPAGDDHINLKLYKERCWPNSEKTKKFELERIIDKGDEAFVTYTGLTTNGKSFRNTEYFKFKDGKILQNECFFGAGINFPNNQ